MCRTVLIPCDQPHDGGAGRFVLESAAGALVLTARAVWWLVTHALAPLMALAVIGAIRAVRSGRRMYVRRRGVRRAGLAATPRRALTPTVIERLAIGRARPVTLNDLMTKEEAR